MTQLDIFDITARFHGNDPRSNEAHDSIKHTAAALRARVLAYVIEQGITGATSDEAEQDLDLTHQTCSARFSELKAAGQLIPAGFKRKTRSGRNADVWCANPEVLA